MSDSKMTEAILQVACDLTVGVIIAYLEEENPNGFDDLGEPPKAKNEAEYALALLHRVQEKFAPDEMRGLKYSDYIEAWFLLNKNQEPANTHFGIITQLRATAPLFGFNDQDILEMWVLIKELRVAPRRDQA